MTEFKKSVSEFAEKQEGLPEEIRDMSGVPSMRKFTEEDELIDMQRLLKEKPVAGVADTVDHPDHYASGKVECIDALESALGPEGFAGFCQGNAIKYLWRYNRKGKALEDLDKARWYLQRLRDATE